MKITEIQTTKNEWKIRRRYMFMCIQFCMSIIGYVVFKEIDTAAAQTAVSMSFVVILGTMSSYVFGATWDDANVRKFIKK